MRFRATTWHFVERAEIEAVGGGGRGGWTGAAGHLRPAPSSDLPPTSARQRAKRVGRALRISGPARRCRELRAPQARSSAFQQDGRRVSKMAVMSCPPSRLLQDMATRLMHGGEQAYHRSAFSKACGVCVYPEIERVPPRERRPPMNKSTTAECTYLAYSLRGWWPHMPAPQPDPRRDSSRQPHRDSHLQAQEYSCADRRRGQHGRKTTASNSLAARA